MNKISDSDEKIFNFLVKLTKNYYKEHSKLYPDFTERVMERIRKLEKEKGEFRSTKTPLDH
jgi:hypothetical protein